ncbi:MAG: hypothetical protein LBJ63_02830 [Prevotellaceae bacterium]|jgi:hypothetical protein|nr:hypothetical protein [Prevotellaceae bacterium]
MILIDGINFNEAWAKAVTEEAFVAHFGRFAYPELTEDERTEKLKQVYHLLTARGAEQPKRTKRQSAE